VGGSGVDEGKLAVLIDELLVHDEAGLAAWARAYAAAGLPVFPLYEVLADGRCACPAGGGCSSPGKHPRLPRGFHAATSDGETVAA
jgi:hypothetical protein